MTHPNISDTKTAVLRDKFKAIKAYNKMKRAHASNLTVHLKALAAKKKSHLRRIDGKKYSNSRLKFHQIEAKKSIKGIIETMNCFFEKINKIEKPCVNYLKV